mmetsp:Transcript_87595/g.225658  ORF Transcript_87595/g.225658 Transcript_87595/m.225658 type:complete len:257 (-) Transcript_87595:1111-1881(-)
MITFLLNRPTAARRSVGVGIDSWWYQMPRCSCLSGKSSSTVRPSADTDCTRRTSSVCPLWDGVITTLAPCGQLTGSASRRSVSPGDTVSTKRVQDVSGLPWMSNFPTERTGHGVEAAGEWCVASWHPPCRPPRFVTTSIFDPMCGNSIVSQRSPCKVTVARWRKGAVSVPIDRWPPATQMYVAFRAMSLRANSITPLMRRRKRRGESWSNWMACPSGTITESPSTGGSEFRQLNTSLHLSMYLNVVASGLAPATRA